MKLSWVGIALLLAGCGSSQKVALAPVSTTQVTSAEIGEANAPSPRVGKAQHAIALPPNVADLANVAEVADDEQPKRPTRSDAPKKGDVFGDWK